MVLTGSLRKWNPRPACGTAFSSVHPILSVCVSTPVPKGSTLFLVLNASSAGACDTLILSHAAKLWIRVGRETWPVSCTCDATVDHAVTPIFPCLIPWSLHDRPQNLFPPQTCSRLATTLTVRVQTLFNHTVLADLFATPFPHLPSQRGN